MAQVTQTLKASPPPDVGDWIDDYLTYLTRSWQSIPQLAAEWDTWDEASRLSFATDWPIREDRLHQLQRWADQGSLTPKQRRHFEQLLALINRNRPALERLLD